MSPRGEPASTPLLGGVALLERAITYSLGTLYVVDPTALHRRTPCADWDLRALLAHLDDSLLALGEAADIGHVVVDQAPGTARHRRPDPNDPAGQAGVVTAIRDRARGLLGAWTNADGEHVTLGDAPMSLPSSLVACAGALEIAVHGWDVAVASGQRQPIPQQLAADLLDLATFLVTDADRPERFAPAVPQPATAGPAERLLGFLGRRA